MVKKNKKKILISGYIGFSNFGDDAMLRVLVEHLNKNEHDITALTSNEKLTSDMYGIKTVHYMNLFGIIGAVMSSDILISGGGNLLQNITSKKSLFYYLFILFLGKLFGKKVIIYSQGIGPINGGFSQFLSKAVLKMVDLITVRDIYSQRILTKWRIKSKFSYDALWAYPTPRHNPDKILGIQMRDYKNFNKTLFSNLARYVNIFFSDYQVNLYAFCNNQDAPICYNLEKLIKKINPSIKTSVIMYKNPEETAREFSTLKYLIAMRLHANILAMKIGVPTLALSYNVKVRNLAYEFGLLHARSSDNVQLHPLLTDLTSQNRKINNKIENAIKKQFEWSYIDKIIEE